MELLILKLVLTALTGIVIGVIGYFLKKRMDKIDALDKDLGKLQSQFSVLEEKLKTLENTNLPILLELKKELGEVKTSISVVQSELKALQKHTDRQDHTLSEMQHFHRRKDDPQP